VSSGKHVLPLYGLLAGVLLALLAQRFGLPSAPPWLVLLLVGLALLAELMPVQLSKRGLRITFTLPYITGLAVLAGPVAAVVADVAISLLGGVAASRTPCRGRWSWLALNASVAAISASGAGLTFAPIRSALPGDAGAATGALAFACTYVLSNFLLVTFAQRAISHGRSEAAWADMRFALQSLGLYALLAVTVALLVDLGHGVFAALTIVPVWALCTALKMRARLYGHYYETMSALTLMLQRAHPYTHGHLERVAATSEDVALRLGLSPDRARMVREAAVLHDIGKIAVDEQILDAPRSITSEEYGHIQKHSEFGAEILRQVPQYQLMVPWIRHHHERLDGTGYPERLLDEEIPVESKIIAVADAFDAMVGTSDQSGQRSYRTALTHDEAVVELRRCSGTQFDGKVVEVFVAALEGGGA